MIVIERGDLVMVFNFHPVQSYTDYRVGCNNPGGCNRGGGGGPPQGRTVYNSII